MQKGAKNGDAVAQWRLGNIYAYGLGYYTKYLSDSDCHTWWYTGDRFVSAGDSKETISNNESIKEMHHAGPNVVVVQKDIKKAFDIFAPLPVIEYHKQGRKSAHPLKIGVEKLRRGDARHRQRHAPVDQQIEYKIASRLQKPVFAQQIEQQT